MFNLFFVLWFISIINGILNEDNFAQKSHFGSTDGNRVPETCGLLNNVKLELTKYDTLAPLFVANVLITKFDTLAPN